jgi:hypothetical protein
MFKRLLLWWAFKPITPKVNMSVENKKAILIFELGALQVFHYQTDLEIQAMQPYKEVFWQDKYAHDMYGPFASIHDAMTHRMWVMSQPVGTDIKSNVINVDFKTKKRIK